MENIGLLLFSSCQRHLKWCRTPSSLLVGTCCKGLSKVENLSVSPHLFPPTPLQVVWNSKRLHFVRQLLLFHEGLPKVDKLSSALFPLSADATPGVIEPQTTPARRTTVYTSIFLYFLRGPLPKVENLRFPIFSFLPTLPQVVLNSEHLRGLRRRGKRAASAQCGGGPSGGRNDKGLSGDREKDEGLGRVEFLPVEWHTRFKGRLYREGGGGGGGSSARGGDGKDRGDDGQGCNVASGSGGDVGVDGNGERGSGSGGAGGLSIWDITLPRAPTLRAFTNDTLLDLLYFMSPEYHQARPHDVLEPEWRRKICIYYRQGACL